MHHKLYLGDVRAVLRSLPDKSIHTCVTSPPYWGLRDYGTPGQLGLEPTPEEYVANMVDVFREVWRVLRDDGTLWLNLGDSYASNPQKESEHIDPKSPHKGTLRARTTTCKPKDLVGIPWRVALALQADGWYLRSDIIWHKPNPMPESVTDRPTKAHEYIFLMSKSERYFYDAEAIKEPAGQNMILPAGSAGAFGPEQSRRRSGNKARKTNAPSRLNAHMGSSVPWEGNTRNKRTVWTVATKPFPGSHFATFPPDLVEPCLLAGSPKGGTVLDPFGGSGTVTMMAEKHGRNSVYIDLNPEYLEMAKERCGFGRRLIDTATYEVIGGGQSAG